MLRNPLHVSSCGTGISLVDVRHCLSHSKGNISSFWCPAAPVQALFTFSETYLAFWGSRYPRLQGGPCLPFPWHSSVAVLLMVKDLETKELITSRNRIDLCFALFLFLERVITVPKPESDTWNRGAVI